jgi:hypothetical protein
VIVFFLLRKARLKEMSMHRMCITQAVLIFVILRTLELFRALGVPQKITQDVNYSSFLQPKEESTSYKNYGH